MKTFSKWNLKPIDDYGSVMSDDAKSFYRAFKNYIKRSFPEAEIVGFKPNHYDTSGFIRVANRCVYVSHNINRATCRVDFNASSPMDGVLFRVARNTKDYRGGQNHFTSIYRMKEDIDRLFYNGPEWAAIGVM